MAKEKKYDDKLKNKFVELVNQRRKAGESIPAAVKYANKQLDTDMNVSIYNWWKAVMAGTYVRPSKKKIEQPSVMPQTETRAFKTEYDAPAPSNTSSGSTLRVVVKEYAFEGDREEVLRAVRDFKRE